MQSTDAVKMGVIPDDLLDQLAKEVLLRYVTPMINAEAGYVSGFLDPDCHLKGVVSRYRRLLFVVCAAASGC